MASSAMLSIKYEWICCQDQVDQGLADKIVGKPEEIQSALRENSL